MRTAKWGYINSDRLQFPRAFLYRAFSQRFLNFHARRANKTVWSDFDIFGQMVILVENFENN